MARRSCRNSALVRSYARKAGGDGSLQARFALRPTAPMFAHARCSHRVWRAYGAAARVLTRVAPELRLPAAASAVGASWQPPALWRVPFRNCPRSCGTPGPITARPAADVAANGWCKRAHPTAVYPRSFGRQRLPRRSAQKKSDQLNAGRFGNLSLWQFADYAQIIQRVPSGDDRARRQAGGA